VVRQIKQLPVGCLFVVIFKYFQQINPATRKLQ